jgi:hypothetical protein
MLAVYVSSYSLTYATDDDQKRIDFIQDQGGLCILAHPNLNGINKYYTYDQIRELKRYTGMELWSVSQRWYYQDSTDKWDAALSLGRKVWGFANDDKEPDNYAGYSKDVVNANSLDDTSIISAMKSGNFYCGSDTDTVVIDYVCDNNGLMTLTLSQSVSTVTWSGKNGVVLKKDYNVSVSTYQITGSEGYIRCTTYRPTTNFYNYTPCMLWLQPVFINTSFAEDYDITRSSMNVVNGNQKIISGAVKNNNPALEVQQLDTRQPSFVVSDTDQNTSTGVVINHYGKSGNSFEIRNSSTSSAASFAIDNYGGVTGSTFTASKFIGDGSSLTGIGSTIYPATATASFPYGMSGSTGNFTGDFTAGAFYGDGSNLTGIATESGDKIYPATSTASFPYGMSASTIEVAGLITAQYSQSNNIITVTTPTVQGINDALAKVPATGGAVFLPAGRYIIDGPITITQNNTKIFGAGRYATTLDASGWTQNAHVLNCAKTYFELCDIGFIGRNAAGSYDLVSLQAAHYSSVHDCYFSQGNNYCIDLSASYCNVYNNYLYNPKKYGINVAGSKNAIYVNIINTAATAAIKFYSANDNTVVGNVMYSCLMDLYIGYASNRLQIVGNSMYAHTGMATAAIEVASSNNNIIIANNNIDSIPAGKIGILFEGGAAGNSVKGNTFSTGAEGSIMVKLVAPSLNTVITNNEFISCSTGVYVSATCTNTVVGFNNFRTVTTPIVDLGYKTSIIHLSEDNYLGIGTLTPTSPLDIKGDNYRVETSSTITNANDPGNTGDTRWDENYIYKCVAPNTWKRTAITTWP